jgi:hypothetical protein
MSIDNYIHLSEAFSGEVKARVFYLVRSWTRYCAHNVLLQKDFLECFATLSVSTFTALMALVRLRVWSNSGINNISLACTILLLIYLLTANGLTPGGSSTVRIYTQTIHRTTQLITHRTTKLIYKCFINDQWRHSVPWPKTEIFIISAAYF